MSYVTKLIIVVIIISGMIYAAYFIFGRYLLQ